MDSEIVGALISASATILGAIIAGFIAIKVKDREIKAKERETGKVLTEPEKQSVFIWWGIGGAILGVIGVLAVLLISGNLSFTIFQKSTSTENAQVLLLDNFDNPNYDGKYNTNLWHCFGCGFDGLTAMQSDNSIKLETQTQSVGGLNSQASWSINEISYLQGKMKLQQTDNGFVNLIFRTILESGGWETDCSINRYSLSQAEFACSVYAYVNGEFKGEYVTESNPVNYDEWYTAKIELIPNTHELRFYLDNQLIGQYIPMDADKLKTKFFSVSFGVSTNTYITAFVDDIFVGRVP